MSLLLELDQGIDFPQYESELAVGFDVRAVKIIAAYKGDNETEKSKIHKMQIGFQQRGFIKLRPFERILFGTGIKAQLPDDMELQVRTRSGVALKRGLIVANSPGTVDPDYRGEIGIILLNSTPFLNQIDLNERIAQLVPKKVVRPAIEIIEAVNTTERGAGGFGSTGT